ncbi:MAG: response regulator transcription factor, partial [Phycisphaerae bacterium]|nr:response regulator transcription factor [Phycisphaerae bacterium]
MTLKPKSPSARKVMIVDDHPILRQGIAKLIDSEDDLVVCGEACDAAPALELAERERPDAAVVDISLKDSNGIDLVKELIARWPTMGILVFSMHDEPFYAERVFRAGAKGYVTKGEPCSQVVEGIRQVLKGEVFVSERLAAKMVDKYVGGRRDDDRRSIDRLSAREFQIFDLIGQGIQTREIAERLHLSVKTVDAHRENIKGKLKLRNATELLKTA